MGLDRVEHRHECLLSCRPRRAGSQSLARGWFAACQAQVVDVMGLIGPGRVSGEWAPESPALTGAISAAIVALYKTVYGHDRTTASTYINDNVVVCVLENILSEREQELVGDGSHDQVIDGRVAFQTDTQDEFTAAVERLTHRRVVAFLSANQTTPGIACELFFLDATPIATAGSPGG